MYLASFLNPRDIVFEPRILTQEQVYRELVEIVSRKAQVSATADELYQRLMDREKEAPTVYPSGIAIPHLRQDDFDDILVVIMFLQNPILYADTRITWAALIITDTTSTRAYLNLVAALMKLSKDGHKMQELIACGEGASVFHLIKKWNIVVKQDLYIDDIMTPDPVFIGPYATLRELIRLMSQHKIAGLPVVDDRDEFVGEVNILSLLKVGIPEYLMSMGSLDFLTSFEPLERLLEKQDELLVKDIMNVDNVVLQPKTSIIEAVYEMIQYKKRYISVVDGKKLVGVVTAMDVFTKVIQA